jgi:DNA-binding protein H-NS
MKHKSNGESNMKIDLESLSFEELQSLSKDVSKAIAGFEKRKKKQALDEMKAVAEKHGLTFSDVVGGASKVSGAKGAPKYANPDKIRQTWTGKGRKPNWVIAALEAGKSLADLAI